MSAGGTGGVGGRREKTTALANECDSRCGAGAATLTDEELEGGTGGTGSLSAHTVGPISSHSRASLCTRFAICLAQKSTPRRSRNPSRRRVLGSAAPYGTPRIGTVVDQPASPNRVAPRVDRVDWCGTYCAGRGTGGRRYGAVCGRVRIGWRVRSPGTGAWQPSLGITGGVEAVDQAVCAAAGVPHVAAPYRPSRSFPPSCRKPAASSPSSLPSAAAARGSGRSVSQFLPGPPWQLHSGMVSAFPLSARDSDQRESWRSCAALE
jgi:hypothetical protein